MMESGRLSNVLGNIMYDDGISTAIQFLAETPAA